MEFLTNLYDPRLKDAKQYMLRRIDETQEEAWAAQTEWLKGKHIGKPKATQLYSVEELEKMGMVGIYLENN